MIDMKNILPEDAVEIGRIAGAWGIKGAVRVISYSEDAEALFSCNQWYLLPPVSPVSKIGAKARQPGAVGAAADVPSLGKKADFKARSALLAQPPAQSWPFVLNVTDVREQRDSIVAMAQEIPDRNQAEMLKGGRIFVSRSQFPDLDKDEFYWVDLIGMKVVNQQNVYLGEVTGLMSNGPQSILRVADTAFYEALKAKQGGEDSGAKAVERLIPFVDAFIENVDREARVISVDWQPDY